VRLHAHMRADCIPHCAPPTRRATAAIHSTTQAYVDYFADELAETAKRMRTTIANLGA
jgi:hypothetical protein